MESNKGNKEKCKIGWIDDNDSEAYLGFIVGGWKVLSMKPGP